jgi:type-F conjugative transfer system secretin TraK
MALKKLVGLFLLLPGLVWANQIITVDPKEQAVIDIAKDDLNRLFITGDRISEYWTANANLDVKTDEEKGELYIKTKDPNEHTPISLFLVTEKGERFSVILNPKLKETQTIELKTIGAVITKAKKTISSENNYELNIVETMRSLHNGEGLGDYVATDKPTYKAKGLKIKTITSLTNGEWVADLLEVTNTNSKPCKLSPKVFTANEVLAVGFLTDALLPKTMTRIFLLRKKTHG